MSDDPRVKQVDAYYETDVEIAYSQWVAQWRDAIDWSTMPEPTLSLVLGNVNGFAAWARENPFTPPRRIRAMCPHLPAIPFSMMTPHEAAHYLMVREGSDD